MSGDLRFSIVVPVCHGGRFLREMLESARRLRYAPGGFELLVAGATGDGQSRTRVEECRAAGLEAAYVAVASANRAVRLNAACAVARGSILAFTDDDCVLPVDWLSKLEGAFARTPSAALVGGADRRMAACGGMDMALDVVLNSFLGTGGCRRGGGGVGEYHPKLWNMAIRREVALQVAPGRKQGRPLLFDESLDVHEDVELAHRVRRAGHSIVHGPEIVVGHYRDTCFGSFLARNFRMARVARRLGVHRLPHLVLAFALVAWLASGVTTLFLAPAALALAAVSGFYVVLLAWSGLRTMLSTGRLDAVLWVPVLLVGLHGARALGYLWPGPRAVRETQP